MSRFPIYAVVVLAAWLAGCSPNSAAQATEMPAASAPPAASLPPTTTPDPCSQANLPQSVKIVNTYVHQFDNYATLAVQVPASQLPQMITSMKAIRQAAQQQNVPTCLTDLKHYALQYMDTVIQTVVDFQSKPNIDKLNAGIMQARQYNDQYAVELARLLGVTLAPSSETSVAEGTLEPAGTPTPNVTTVLNPGPNPLNLHVSPSLTSQSVGLLNANETAVALGRSANGEWIKIEVPGQSGTSAWVYASLVQYTSGNPGMLPIATP